MLPNAINRMYRGRMRITAFRVAVTEDGETVLEPYTLCEDKPCALSVIRSSLSQKLSVSEDGGTLEETARHRIFCDNDFFIPRGCRIVVHQDGRESEFSYAGQAFIYSNHQELTVKSVSRA